MSVTRRASTVCTAIACVLTITLAQAKTPEACQGADLGRVEGLVAAESVRAEDLFSAQSIRPSTPRSKSPVAPPN
jgi:hypothetical protein